MATGKPSPSKYIHVTGVPNGVNLNTGYVPVRREFNDFVKDADSLNLYLLGLERMKNLSQSEKLSFYQIAGIHGRPYRPWDNVGDSDGDNDTGYCSHSSILFATWHRPYLALFEQTLYSCVQAVVNQYPIGPKRDRYKKVAETWRMPYWDWAATLDVPDLVSCINPKDRNVAVDHPTKGATTIPNPLYSYRFSAPDFQKSLDVAPYNVWEQTVRHPPRGSRTDAKAESDPQKFETLFAAFAARPGFATKPALSNLNIRDRIFGLLSPGLKYDSYQAFSNDAWDNNGRTDDYDSLESVHNLIHTLTGGGLYQGDVGGHMGDPQVAAFDPIFWLHHSNVDRIFALWQALHPKSWTINQRAPGGTNFWEEGVDTNKTPLVPFHKTDRAYWTSDDIRDLRVFGSTYPELATPGATPEQLKASVAAAVAKLYGKSTPPHRLLRAVNDSPEAAATSNIMLAAVKPVAAAAAFTTQAVPASKEKAQAPLQAQVQPQTLPAPAVLAAKMSGQDFDINLTAPLGDVVNDGKFYNDWICNIRAAKYSLDGSFIVNVFLGQFSDDPSDHQYDENLVGSVAVWTTNISTTKCSKCKTNDAQNLTVTGAVPLTGALLDRVGTETGKVRSLEPTDVVPYLKENLHWRVNKIGQDFQHIKREDVPDLKVGVTAVTVQLPRDNHSLPIYQGDWQPMPEVTENKTSGIVAGDDL